MDTIHQIQNVFEKVDIPNKIFSLFYLLKSLLLTALTFQILPIVDFSDLAKCEIGMLASLCKLSKLMFLIFFLEFIQRND